jgi:TRAP transporter TAXI family solute receptor
MKCDFCKIGLPLILIVVVGFAITYHFVPPPPPKTFSIATGSTVGAYYAYSIEYQKGLEKQGFTLAVQPTAGSIEALQLLKAGKVDLAFIQGGVAKDMPTEGLHSLASLFYEPLWIFHRKDQPLQYLYELRGKRVAIGAEGSGTRPLAMQMLYDNGLDDKNTTFLGLTSPEAKQKLESGEIDAAFFVVSPKATMISELLHNPAIELLSIKRALAYTSRYSFLSSVTIGEGMFDLQNNIPAHDIVLLTVTASLVAREGFNSDLIRLILKEAIKIHNPPGLLEKKNQFPSELFLEIPIHKEAEEYLRTGSSWLEKILPFWLASKLDRLKILLIPILTLLLPLFKGILPIYRWSIRSKTYRWYETLHQVDRQLESFDTQVIEQEIERLTILQKELAKQVAVPLSYMAEFYDLRLHINLILSRLEERQDKLLTQDSKKLLSKV